MGQEWPEAAFQWMPAPRVQELVRELSIQVCVHFTEAYSSDSYDRLVVAVGWVVRVSETNGDATR